MLDTKMLKESIELLAEACEDKDGVIVKTSSFDGLSIKTNSKEFVEQKNPRSEALWAAAVDELELKELVRDLKGNGQVYFVTHKGYSIHDRLKEN
jgi:hypothetical protein